MKIQSNFVRKLYKRIPSEIEIPEELQDRPVEVLLLPLDNEENTSPYADKASKEWFQAMIDRTAGQWVGEPLVRESQGDYETRDCLD